jgi:hypothetical protein
LFGCQPEISNDKKTIEYLFSLDKFEIEIEIIGCLAHRKEQFVIEKIKNEHIFYSKKYSFQNHINQEEIYALKQFLLEQIKTESKDLSLCTGKIRFKASSIIKGIELYDNDCSKDWEILQKILNYQEVWNIKK